MPAFPLIIALLLSAICQVQLAHDKLAHEIALTRHLACFQCSSLASVYNDVTIIMPQTIRLMHNI